MDFFATAAHGTEPALRDELKEHGFRAVRADRGGVHFAGEDLLEGARACLLSRVAVRVLLRVGSFPAGDERALYAGVRGLDLSAHLTPRQTLAISAVSQRSRLTHTQYLSQLVKDAVVDAQRDRAGARSSVDVRAADVRLFLHLRKDVGTLYLDLAGEPLHLRGYRTLVGEAPLKETLAAAIVRLSGWDRARPLVDPMCGSGTLAIEADLLARDVAPGLLRRNLGLTRWASHDAGQAARLRALHEALPGRVRAEGPPVRGSDRDPSMVEVAIKNARAAASRAQFSVADVGDLAPTDPPGTILINPPYGGRLETTLDAWRDLGRVLRRLRGHRVAVLCPGPDYEDALALPRGGHDPELRNGDLTCRLLVRDL